MSYFLLFLFFFFLIGFFGSSSFFFGLPLEAASFIASKTSSEYNASFVIGLYPPRKIRRNTVSLGRLRIVAISVIVIPVISYIIGIFKNFFRNIRYEVHLLQSCIVVFEKKLIILYFLPNNILTYCSLWSTFIIDR